MKKTTLKIAMAMMVVMSGYAAADNYDRYLDFSYIHVNAPSNVDSYRAFQAYGEVINPKRVFGLLDTAGRIGVEHHAVSIDDDDASSIFAMIYYGLGYTHALDNRMSLYGVAQVVASSEWSWLNGESQNDQGRERTFVSTNMELGVSGITDSFDWKAGVIRDNHERFADREPLAVVFRAHTAPSRQGMRPGARVQASSDKVVAGLSLTY